MWPWDVSEQIKSDGLMLNYRKKREQVWWFNNNVFVKPSNIGDNKFDGFVINEKIPQRVNDKKTIKHWYLYNI